jgi:hypothetical protein
MRRTTVFVEESVERELDLIAAREGRPKAELIREALARYVAQAPTAPAPRFVAIAGSGQSDVADRHEEILSAEIGADSLGTNPPPVPED